MEKSAQSAQAVGKPPSASTVVVTQLVQPNHTNYLGNLYGGELMKWIDMAAAMAAMKHSGRVCVTVSVDELSFLAPVKLGQIVTLYATVNRAFRTSMEVGVRAERFDPLSQETVHTNSAYLTFVAIDENGKPVEVPPIIPQTAIEQRRYQEAEIRRQHRLEKRKQIESLRKRR